jgi:hypothetical protein
VRLIGATMPSTPPPMAGQTHGSQGDAYRSVSTAWYKAQLLAEARVVSRNFSSTHVKKWPHKLLKLRSALLKSPATYQA